MHRFLVVPGSTDLNGEAERSSPVSPGYIGLRLLRFTFSFSHVRLPCPRVIPRGSNRT